ncbi:MAG: Rid family detoxifying hydrolase [Coriobacteriales bacterium]|jgi:2-iminobutanoate/2-iminopropanoate deaminase
MDVISTANAPAAVGPYSQAIRTGNLVFCSGQIPLDPATGALVGATIEEQALQSCQNVMALLAAAGTDAQHVVKTTCYLADIADFAAFNTVYAEFFPGCPARSCVEVGALPKGALCEVEAIAEIEE